MQKDNKMMNLVTQVRGEGLLGLFQEVNMITQEASTILKQTNAISDGCNTVVGTVLLKRGVAVTKAL